MNTDPPAEPPAPAVKLPPPPPAFAPTPLSWRLGLAGVVVGVGGLAWLARDLIGLRGQAACGAVCFFALAAAFSANLRAVNWRTIGWGIGLQLILALLVLQGRVRIGDREFSVYNFFDRVGALIKKFIGFTDEGAQFVFGNLARYGDMAEVFGKNFLFPFAFIALPTIVFVSAFFTVLYHYGVV